MPSTVERYAAIKGINKALAEKLVESGAKTKKDLLRKKYFDMLTREAKAFIKYTPLSSFSWEFANKIVTQFPRNFIPVGSYRRKAARLTDIDLLTTLTMKNAADILLTAIENSRTLNLMCEYSSGSERRSYIISYNGDNIQIDLFRTTCAKLPFALLHHTGSKNFNIRVRAHAKKNGYKLSQHGLEKDGEQIPAKSEREILQIIGVSYKKPEMRNE